MKKAGLLTLFSLLVFTPPVFAKQNAKTADQRVQAAMPYKGDHFILPTFTPVPTAIILPTFTPTPTLIYPTLTPTPTLPPNPTQSPSLTPTTIPRTIQLVTPIPQETENNSNPIDQNLDWKSIDTQDQSFIDRFVASVLSLMFPQFGFFSLFG